MLRGFDTRTGKILWTFQTGFQIAAGPSVYSVGGKQYIAVTVGGTPTSSNGGTATRIQVFALDGSKQQSPPPTNLPALRQTAGSSTPPPTLMGSPLSTATPARATAPASTTAAAGATIQVGARPFVRRWQATGSNEQIVVGRLLLRGAPVRGARVRVDRYQLLSLTDAAGRFRYRADVTTPRHDHRRRSRVPPCRRRPLERERAGALGEGDQRRTASPKCGQTARERERARQRARDAGARERPTSGRPVHLHALREDHGLGRAPGAKRRRGHAHARPRLLDVLGTE